MIDRDRFLNELKKIKARKIGKDRLLIALLIGILLLVITIPIGNGGESTGKTNEEADGYTTGTSENGSGAYGSLEQEYVSRMEAQLSGILSQMEGVGEVQVMITLKESSEKVIEKDTEVSGENVTEKDSQGGERTTQNENRKETTIYSAGEGESDAYYSQADQSKEPYVSKELSPRVEGVLVVASGGDDAVVIKNITEAVQALFGIDTHKIRIVKKE